MKKFLVLFAMMAFVGTMASAQSTPEKTCTKSKAACAKSKTACTKSKATQTKLTAAETQELPSCPVKAAAQLSSYDESITSKTCAASGKVTYYQKSVCSSTGKVTMKQVQYDDRAQSFVNVSPTELNAKPVSTLSNGKKACSTADKKACSKKAASSCSTKTASGDSKKASCCSKKKTASNLNGKAAEVKQVKLEEK